MLLPAAGATEAGAASERPNILLLVAEDMSPRVGAFGDPVARTPNLDRLARQGVRFPNTFTTAGVCAPSRAALILGRHQIATGTQHMRTTSRPEGAYLAVPPPDARAFPELLRAAGYFTYQHAKLDYQFSGPLSGSGPSTIWDAEDNTGAWADRSPGQPFFGMLNAMVTHESGLFPPLGHWPRGLVHLAMQLMQVRARWSWSDVVVPTDPAAVRLPPYYPDLEAIRRDLARHYDNVQIMDAQVGATLDRLERDGLAGSTIVIWTTDHGDGLPRAKRELHDSGIRVPLIVRWPEALRPAHYAPGHVDRQLVSFVDLTAAILALGGVAPPAGLHGRDFLDPDTPRREYVYAARDRIDATPDRQRAVRDRRYKYIWSDRPGLPEGHPLAFREHLASVRALRAAWRAGQLDPDQRRWFEPVGRERLFDLDTDPHELRNLVDDPAHRATLERMRRALADWQARVPDWSEMPEAEMVERFWPGGEQPETAAPRFEPGPDGLRIVSPTPGASIEYRLGRGRWQVHAEPIPVEPGVTVSARAVRYGWSESPLAHWRASVRTD